MREEVEIPEIALREFAPGDETPFRRLNEEWIERYFKIEPKDLASLMDPQRTIIEQGGRVVFAVSNGNIIGCCALLAMGPGEYEVAKMAVTASAQGTGVGRRLLQECIAIGRKLHARRLYLETNHTLTPAIALYESIGFRHIAPERVTPSPYARADVYMEMEL